MGRTRRITERPRTEMVRVEFIEVGDRHRQPASEAVARLAASMQEIGLRTPITVRYFPDRPGVDGTADSYVLVAGGHRLAAAKLLGWEEIECFEADADDVDAELWESDENLCRAELSVTESAAAITTREKIYVRLHGEKHGGDRKSETAKSSRQVGDLISADRFTLDTAAKTGKSERAIQRALKRGKEIGVDNLARITGTSLDSGAELDALVSMPPEQRGPLIERAASGEKVTARITPAPKPDPQPILVGACCASCGAPKNWRELMERAA